MGKKRLNLQGEICPIPLMIIQKEMTNLTPGDMVIVETDMNQTVRNILRWCETHHHNFEIDEIEDGLWFISIKK